MNSPLLSSCLGRLATVPPTRSGRDENEPLRVKPMVLPGRRVGRLNCSAVKQYRQESCGGGPGPCTLRNEYQGAAVGAKQHSNCVASTAIA
jgi:hypothetical protein